MCHRIDQQESGNFSERRFYKNVSNGKLKRKRNLILADFEFSPQRKTQVVYFIRSVSWLLKKRKEKLEQKNFNNCPRMFYN